MVAAPGAVTAPGAVWALVTARSGSKGIEDKNLQLLEGHSLLAWSIAAGTAVPGISRVFVSTDSCQYANHARTYDAEIPFLRPAELATDDATDRDVFLNFLEWAVEVEGQLPEVIVHLRPTSPIRDPAVIEACVTLALGQVGYASAVRSVHEAPESPFKWFLMTCDGYLNTLDEGADVDEANSARQSFPKVYVPNGYVDCIYPQRVLDTGLLHGSRVLGFETPPVVEVDTRHDLEILRAVGGLPNELVRSLDQLFKQKGEA